MDGGQGGVNVVRTEKIYTRLCVRVLCIESMQETKQYEVNDWLIQ